MKKIQPNPASLDPQTLVVHDEHDEVHYGAVTMPTYQNSLFTFPTHAEFDAAMDDGRGRFVYTRGNNPTVRALEQRLAALEGGERARCFASGMAAISSAILSTVRAGDHIVCVDQVYGPAKQFMSTYLKRFGVETTFFDGTSVDSLRNAMRPNTTTVYLESPTSMSFELQDIEACARLARSRGAVTMIDNTWATPCYQSPLALGVDLVVHSLTKYIGGHSDVVAGVVVGSEERMERLNADEFMLLGGIMTPQSAALLLRGLRTLPLRMEKLQANGFAIARYLEQLPFVAKVNHPGLDTHPQHELGRRQMTGYSSLLSFETKGVPLEQMRRWGDALAYFRIGVSWGGYESLVIVSRQNEAQKESAFVRTRLYIGLEEPALLIEDMERAFREAGIH